MTTIMEPINTLIKPAELRELQADAYWDKGRGLILCSACHTPRQTHQTLFGQDMVVDCLCKCQAEKRDQEEAERRDRERMETIRRMKTEGLQDPHLRKFTFSHDEGYNPVEIGYARAYVQQWETMKQKNMGLLFWGDVGTGKSFLAGCIANALIDRCVPVLMTNFPRILNALTDPGTADRNGYVDNLNRYSLLILDDLGVGRNTEFALEQLFHVIDSRCRSRKPMIITTNIPLEELRHPADLEYQRIYDRILACCTPICVSSRNLRREKAAHGLTEMRGLLSACG